MYQLHEFPDSMVRRHTGERAFPLATLADEHGGRAHIVNDDQCYQLLIQRPDGYCVPTRHWFPEAIEAIAREGRPDDAGGPSPSVSGEEEDLDDLARRVRDLSLRPSAYGTSAAWTERSPLRDRRLGCAARRAYLVRRAVITSGAGEDGILDLVDKARASAAGHEPPTPNPGFRIARARAYFGMLLSDGPEDPLSQYLPRVSCTYENIATPWTLEREIQLWAHVYGLSPVHAAILAYAVATETDLRGLASHCGVSTKDGSFERLGNANSELRAAHAPVSVATESDMITAEQAYGPEEWPTGLRDEVQAHAGNLEYAGTFPSKGLADDPDLWRRLRSYR